MPPIEDWFRFVYADPDGLEEAGLTDTDLARLEAVIVNDPDAGDVIAGTGGLRKLRFAREGRGKSGGCRVCYVVFPDHGVVIVPLVYAKSRKGNLTPAEKRAFKRLLDEYAGLLEEELE